MTLRDADLILNPDGSVYHLNILPEHVGEYVITVGDPERVPLVSQYFDRVESRISKREFVTHVGMVNGKRVTVISSGIGTDNVEILLTELDAAVNIDLKARTPKTSRRTLKIIRVGTSGAMQAEIAVGSFLASNYAVGFDNLMSFYELVSSETEDGICRAIGAHAGLGFKPYIAKGSEPLRQIFGADMFAGNTVTSPGFYAPQGRHLALAPKYPNLLENLSNFRFEALDFRLTNFEMETAAYYALGRLLGHEILSVNAIIANRIQGRFADDPNKITDNLIKKIISRI